MSEPVSIGEAETRLKLFFDELYDLRNKHKIADVYVVARLNVTSSDGEGPITTCMHCGSDLEREGMAAFALGFERSQRADRIINIMDHAGKVKCRELVEKK